MSLDEQYEVALYNAVMNIARLPMPKWRERVMRETIHGIMRIMGWVKIEIINDHLTVAVPFGAGAKPEQPQ